MSKVERNIDRMVRQCGHKKIKMRSVQAMARLQDTVIGSTFGGVTDSRVLDDLTDLYICLQTLKVVYDITDQEFEMLTRYKIEKMVDSYRKER